MIIERNALDAQLLAQVALLLAHHLLRVLRLPLEGREGLGHKHGRAARHAQPLRALAPWARHKYASTTFCARSGNAVQILGRFRRQTDHEVQLDAAPSAVEGVWQTLLIRSSSVTPLLMTSRRRWVPGFGREGQAGLSSPSASASSESFSTLSRRSDWAATDRHMLLVQPANQLANQLRQTGIIAGRQARQADFLIARSRFRAACAICTRCSTTPLAHRTVQDARLTEAAAARAAAHDFQHNAVVDNLHVRHRGFPSGRTPCPNRG